MKHWIPAALLIALWVVVLVILLTPEIPDGQGFAHSRFQAMDQGGDGAARHESLLVTGWIFGCVSIAIFVSLLAWAAAGRAFRADQRWAAFILGGLIYEGVFGMLCLAYRNSLTNPEAAFLGPFPAGVSWLLFGIWLSPVFFISLYVVFFHRWIMPPQSVKELAALAGQAFAPDEKRRDE